ncbi:hypothetical protein [Streptomyces sp. CAU 1734]|uniref:hypothetical protein n=1 Tax=Streptomyces sp. CAU 1734 TaxID=3140360 RepID=UPI003261C5D9
MSVRKTLTAIGSTAALTLGGLTVATAPAMAAPAGPEQVRATCTAEYWGFGGRARCTNAPGQKWRVKVGCTSAGGGPVSTIYGSWRTSGWSEAICHPSGGRVPVSVTYQLE